MPVETVMIDLNKTFTRVYQLRPTGEVGSTTVESSIPREPLEREAKSRGIAIAEFIRNYEIEWHYGDFPGLYVSFRQKDQKEK